VISLPTKNEGIIDVTARPDKQIEPNQYGKDNRDEECGVNI